MRWGRGIGLGLTVAAVGAALSLIPAVLELEETVGLSWLFSRRGPLPAPDDVVVVGISAASAEAFGVSEDLDEWPRALHAQLIDCLADAGAAVIAFDLIFDQAGRADQDRRLADSIRRAGNLVLLERTRSRPLTSAGRNGTAAGVLEFRLPPIEAFEEGALATAPFQLPTVPVKVSQFWTFGRAATDTPSLPSVVLQAFAASVYGPLVDAVCRRDRDVCADVPVTWRAARHEHAVQSAMRRIRGAFRADAGLADAVSKAVPADTDVSTEHRLLRALTDLYSAPSSRYLNYYGPARTITTIPFQEILNDPSVLADKYDVRGKAVFVGVSEPRQPEQQDQFYSVFSLRTGQNLSGVEIGATAFANLLQGDSVLPLQMLWHIGFVFAWGLALGLLLRRLPAMAAIAAALALGASYLWFVDGRFVAAGTWWPIVVPVGMQLPLALFGALLLGYREVHAQRERVQTALGRYVPRQVAARLARESFTAGASREVLHGTCLVADVEHFTGLSEMLGPAELGELMNEYYDVLCTAAERCGGLIADISADSMVAIWAAARPDVKLHRQACRAALQLRAEVAQFNASRGAQALPTGFGLNSGELLLGNIGAAQRYEYRAVGDIVNTASRVQGLNRQLGTQILISDATRRGAGPLVARDLGCFYVVGKRSPVRIHELWGAERDATPPETRLIEAFGAALDRFAAGELEAARDGWRRLLAEAPDDGPSRFYVVECERRLAAGPQRPWDGTVTITAK
jgi:adenylate cyclase